MRFLVILSCLVMAVVSGALLLLLAPVPIAQLERLGHLVFIEDHFARMPLALTTRGYGMLRLSSWAVLGGSAVAGLLLLTKPVYRQELHLLRSEIKTAWAALLHGAVTLSKAEKCIAGGLLALVLAARLFLLVRYGFRYDELISYLVFVREGPLVVASYYPLPNNHVFFNLCCTVLNQVLSANPLLVMRLPSLLAATAGTALSYALLTRATSFRLATLVTGLFTLSPPALYYAASGRGYYLQMVFVQLGFFAVVALGCAPRSRRLAWLVFVLSSILGLYTIPTYAYPLASLLLGSLLVLRARPGGLQAHGPELLSAAALVGAATVLLYAPVGTVSGWNQLLGNSYVRPMPWSDFRALALANVYEKAGALFGLVRPVLLVGAALLAGIPAVLWRYRLRPALRSLAWVSWAMLVAPVVLVVAQRTYPPVRAVVYLAFFGFLLAGLVARAVVQQKGRKWSSATQWVLIGGCVLGYAGARSNGILGRIRSSQHEEAQLTHAWSWLRAYHPQRVFLGSYALFFYYYASQAPQRVALADQPAPGKTYDYLVLPAATQQPPSWAGPRAYRRVYLNDLVSIFALSTSPAVRARP